MPDQPVGKICVRCGKDVAGQPRTKDRQGRYFCRPCVEALTAKAEARKAEPAAAHEPAAACPGCGQPLDAGAVLCTNCGYNTTTGRGVGTEIVTEPEENKTARVAVGAGRAAVAAAASAPTAWVLAGIGAVVAGAVGAALWAFVALAFNLEIGWLAWGVGGLVGLGARLGARGHAGLISGSIAAAVAIGAILAGKFIVVTIVVGTVQLAEAVADDNAMWEQTAIGDLADGIAGERMMAGEQLDWPAGMDLELAIEPEDYPPGIWDEAAGRWDETPEDERAAHIAGVRAEFDELMDSFRQEGVASSIELLDYVFFGLALVTAFGLGSGGRFGDD